MTSRPRLTCALTGTTREIRRAGTSGPAGATGEGASGHRAAPLVETDIDIVDEATPALLWARSGASDQRSAGVAPPGAFQPCKFYPPAESPGSGLILASAGTALICAIGIILVDDERGG